jgi:hypothetical protein
MYPLCLLLLLSSVTALATPPSLTLYQSPDTQSQVISTISPQEGVTIVPVTWVQIRDPQTKKIGWVQQEALRTALQQNPLDEKHMTSNTPGSYQSISTIRTMTRSTGDDTAIEATQQYEALPENVRQAFQQMRAMEAKLFDDTAHTLESSWNERPAQGKTLWSYLFNWN